MNNYKIQFVGKTIGAIGISQKFVETVFVDSEENAVLKLYEKYEHIRVISCEII